MVKEYKVNVDGREIIYGALVRDDGRLSVKEWMLLPMKWLNRIHQKNTRSTKMMKT